MHVSVLSASREAPLCATTWNLRSIQTGLLTVS